MNLTFSPKVSICSPKKFKSDEFITNVNNVLSDLDFLTDESPPPIPKELIYEPPLFKIKKMASEIGNKLEKVKSENSLKDTDVLSAFINFGFDLSTSYQPETNEIDPLRTIFDFLSKNRKNIHYPSHLYPANDILIIVSFMTPKSLNNELKRQVHQCFAVLGSNTLHQLTDKIVCPICKISEVTAGPHCVPDQFEIDDKIYYNFNQGFDQSFNEILTKINCCGNYKSKGGCTHLVVFNGAFAVHVNENYENYFNPNNYVFHPTPSKKNKSNKNVCSNSRNAINATNDLLFSLNFDEEGNKDQGKTDEEINDAENSDRQSDNEKNINKETNNSENNKNTNNNKSIDKESDNTEDDNDLLSVEDIVNKEINNSDKNRDQQNDEDTNDNANDDIENESQSNGNYNFNGLRNNYGDLSFPVEIAGKGANPPKCYICKLRPGSIVVKDDNFVSIKHSLTANVSDDDNDDNYDDDEEEDFDDESNRMFPFRFFCQKCFKEADFDKENAIVIDLTEHFFTPLR